MPPRVIHWRSTRAGEFHIAQPQPEPHSGPTTRMKALFLATLLSITSAVLLCGAEPTKLSVADRAALMKTAQSVQRAFDAGDADAIIRHTHPVILKFFGSREQFENTTRQAVKSMAGQITVEKTEWGEPSAVYVSGTDEVCFVPKTSIMRVTDKRARSVGFLIAARAKGDSEWQFLDGAPLRKDTSVLWQLFPMFPKDVPIPANTIELLK
jgi:hypothetical protein